MPGRAVEGLLELAYMLIDVVQHPPCSKQLEHITIQIIQAAVDADSSTGAAIIKAAPM